MEIMYHTKITQSQSLKMFRNILIAIVFSSSYHLFAQTETVDFKKFQLGINYSADMNYRYLQKNENSSVSNFTIQNRDQNELPKYGNTFGINLAYQLKRNLSLETGLQYSNKGYVFKTTLLTTIDPGDPLVFGDVRLFHIYEYLGIPLKINYFLGKKSLRFVSSLGICPNFLIQDKSKYIYESPNGERRNVSKNNDDYNKFNLSATASVGIDYRISDRMNIRLEPTCRYGLLKIIDNTPVTAYLFNAGVNLSYYVGF
jgi:hypothetical protein